MNVIWRPTTGSRAKSFRSEQYKNLLWIGVQLPISKRRRRRGRVAPGSSRSAASLSLNQTKRKTNWLYLSASLVIAILVIGGFVVGSGGFGTGAVANKTGSSDEHVDGIGLSLIHI